MKDNDRKLGNKERFQDRDEEAETHAC